MTSEVRALHQLPCTVLRGVGQRMAMLLENCDIYSVQDLLFHLPVRYQNRTVVKPIRELKAGDTALVEGEIVSSQIQPGRRQKLVCVVSDGTGQVQLLFLHFSPGLQRQLSPGRHLRCFGEIRGDFQLSLFHPEYQFPSDSQGWPEADDTLTPIYPSTQGISQLRWRQMMAQALTLLETQALVDELPEAWQQSHQLWDLPRALLTLHRPDVAEHPEQLLRAEHPAQKRLIFEELLAYHLSLRQYRQETRAQRAPKMTATRRGQQAFLKSLPFQLTTAQQRVAAEIQQDLETETPMQRLVQGDVGSGKTVIAALAALQVIQEGYQVALMAPTELLAEQHLINFKRWLAPFDIEISWLSGLLSSKHRRRVQEDMVLGLSQMVIGTHALFQKAVTFKKLGLIIIDEQHRFGVAQRLSLLEKGQTEWGYPHQLMMSATPIPRTLAMSAYADLDTSVIDELPPGRQPITTVVLPDSRRDELIARIAQVCAVGRQVYWVCTLIETSEKLQAEAAEQTFERLAAALPDLQVSLVHGRLDQGTRQERMAAFKAGQIDVLVATTVIEVGVDVPNASLMIIENPERLGLSQLHQLRGRVGRGSEASFCLLLYTSPLTEKARQRLAVLRDHQDGFVIARHDLQLRGPGEVLGTRQTGVLALKIADLIRDEAWLAEVQTLAETLLAEHPEVVSTLIARWQGRRGVYGQV